MRFRLFVLVSLFAATGWAVAPQFWRVRSADDFLAGDIEGFAVTSRGELRPGPSLRKLGTFTDPFVLSQTTAPNGDRFFGTGNAGKVYRLRGTELKLIYTAPEQEVYSLAFHDGALYAGTSPNGKVYRIDPNDGKAADFFDPKQAYIWSMEFLPGGDLAVATGVEGKLFRVTPKGEGKVFFDSPDTHLRSMAVKSDGTLLVGGSSKARIYEVKNDGAAHALFESPLSEIASLYVDANGIGWAAAATTSLPTSAPAKREQSKPTGQQATGSGASAEKKDEKEGTPNVEVSFSFDDSSSSGGQPSAAGSCEVYRINPDGFVETVRKFERELAYSITGGPNGAILLATGPQGRIYSLKDGEVSLVATAPEKQVVSISTTGNETLITTTNSGAVYRMETSPSARAEFRSAAKDVERFSKFGDFRIDGQDVGDGHLAIAFRSGNTRTPDGTWSAWSTPVAASEGAVGVPPARYLQWKITTPKPLPTTAIDTVTVAYLNRNVAPVIDSVVVQDPAVVFITGAYPPSPQVVEATNPDEYGIFTSLDTPRDTKNDPGKRVFRKGFRTVTWRARDENGDSIRYALSFRRKGADKWLRLRDNMEETSLNFDTSQLPDGTYELRLVATDAQDNPEMPLSDEKEGVEFRIDNAPPLVAFSNDGDDVVVRVSDKLSPVGKVEYSADAQKWVRLIPVDGIADSQEETYRLKRAALAGKFVIVRAVDAFYNVGTESITLP